MAAVLIEVGIILPFRISFIPLINSNGWLVYDILTDLVFGFDLLINFVSVYTDKNNQLVTSYYLIAKNYILSWFFIDILSMFFNLYSDFLFNYSLVETAN